MYMCFRHRGSSSLRLSQLFCHYHNCSYNASTTQQKKNACRVSDLSPAYSITAGHWWSYDLTKVVCKAGADTAQPQPLEWVCRVHLQHASGPLAGEFSL